MKINNTNRGFQVGSFKDQRGNECSIQVSSNAMTECIWLGSNKIGLQEFKAGQGWVDHAECDEHTMAHHYVANNRMELSRKQVEKLLPLLENFVKTGNLK